MVFDRKILVIPDNVKYEEHNIVTKGDFIIGDRTNFGLGLITDGRVFVGEKTKIKGNIVTPEDIRIDMWSEVFGDLKSDKNVFLAEKVKVKGKLSVGRDLDLADSAEIEKFEAKGWINVRSPISFIIYIYLYLLELMRQGRSQEVEMILNELDEENEEFIISEVFTFVPNDSEITLQKASIKGHCRVGDNCRILGNYSVSGFVKIGNKTKFHGSIEAGRDVDIGSSTDIVGSVTSKGKVTIEENTHIFGNVKAKTVEMLKSVIIDGMIKAQDGVNFTSQESRDIKVKVDRFERGLDDFDAVLD
ncbi:MAG: polymer-forming cytoskeletal protein [Methanomassiliicoccales archaeon]|nr:MAG: polymer-forming cytoskeletal protein [Methanomassiliicoccales archaeon]